MRDTPVTWPEHNQQRPAARDATESRLFVLHLKDREFLLPRGEFVVGRSRSCDLVLDDMLISRRHARFFVSRASLFVEDLGSANGVLVNEVATSGAVALNDADRVIVGTHELSVQVVTNIADRETAPPPEPKAPPARAPAPSKALTEQDIPVVLSTPALEIKSAGDPASFDNNLEETLRTDKMDGLATMARLADRMISMGRAEAAVRLLGDHLRDLLDKVKQGRSVPPSALETAGIYGMKLTDISKDGAWVTLVIELFTHVRKPLPAKAVQMLEALCGASIEHFDRQKLAFYKAALREARGLSPNEVTLVERILKLPMR